MVVKRSAPAGQTAPLCWTCQREKAPLVILTRHGGKQAGDGEIRGKKNFCWANDRFGLA